MFQLPLSAKEEYWAGYFRADGCLVRKPRGKIAIFAQKNRIAVEEYASFIGADLSRITYIDRMSNFGRNILYKITSAKPAHALDELGVKTDLEPSLYKSKHFWRGLLDGDGSVGFVNNAHKLYPAMAWSGSEYDMWECSQWLGDWLNCKPPKVGTARSIFRVGLNGGKAKYVALHLYEGEYSALAYKREAALSFNNWEPTYATKSWHPAS